MPISRTSLKTSAPRSLIFGAVRISRRWRLPIVCWSLSQPCRKSSGQAAHLFQPFGASWRRLEQGWSSSRYSMTVVALPLIPAPQVSRPFAVQQN